MKTTEYVNSDLDPADYRTRRRIFSCLTLHYLSAARTTIAGRVIALSANAAVDCPKEVCFSFVFLF